MKLEKEEFKKKYSEIFEDDDKKIEFLEDFTDTFTDESNSDDEDYKKKYEELKEKYTSRFFDTKKEDDQKDKKDEEEIDIKEIF